MKSPDNSPARVSRAMILAAGLGTRFKPWTDGHPKALALVNGKSLLQRNIEYLQRYGIGEVVVNVHHFAGQIVESLMANKGWGSRFLISDETGAVLETGGGLMKARPLLEGVGGAESGMGDRRGRSEDTAGPFVLINVDILTDMDLQGLIDDHFRYRPLATLAVTDRSTSRYLLFDERNELCGWRNESTGQERMARLPGGGASRGGPVQKAFSGIHVIDPAVFSLVSREGKFSMVDLYLDLAAKHPIRGYDHSRSKLIDVGKPEAVEMAETLFP